MGICDEVNERNEYCGYMLTPEDVGMETPTGGMHVWHEAAENAVCIREPRYDGLCVWHADTDQKDSQELKQARLTSADVSQKRVCKRTFVRGCRARTQSFETSLVCRVCVDRC